MTGQIEFLDLLRLLGFQESAPDKFVRHKSDNWDLEQLYRAQWLDLYQAFQARPVFDGCQHIVSFLGIDKTYAKFIGVYSVGDRSAGAEWTLPLDYPHPEHGLAKYHYELDKVDGFEELEDRVIVDWGRGTRSWAQRIRNSKPVVEYLRSGAAASDRVPIFRDYLDFSLTHADLVRVFDDPESHPEWRARLEAVSGVYLILDPLEGRQYVGSASGEAGIWGRWSAYSRNGHGGNKRLRDLIASDPRYPGAFVYSLLQILPGSLTRDEVLGSEGRWKHRLGSRATGLNLN